MSKAIAAKLRLGSQSREADVIGGATLSFDLAPDHPLGGEVHALLRTVRAQVNELWHKVSVYNLCSSSCGAAPALVMCVLGCSSSSDCGGGFACVESECRGELEIEAWVPRNAQAQPALEIDECGTQAPINLHRSFNRRSDIRHFASPP